MLVHVGFIGAWGKHLHLLKDLPIVIVAPAAQFFFIHLQRAEQLFQTHVVTL